MTGPTDRRWRLEVYAGKDLIHESTCVGDRGLDEAMKRLEGKYPRPRIVVRAA